ncbi:MAG TPA: hypothetical protein VGK87_16590 [Anaerolineae bacterium]|jgi:hypothetical protein
MNVLAMLFLLTGLLLGTNTSTNSSIYISGNAGFAACGCASLVGNVWVIGPRLISGATGDGVYIENVTAPFQLVNLTVNSSSGAGIHLKNVNGNGGLVIAGAQTSIQNNNIGIIIENSTNLVLDGKGANPNGWGTVTSGAAGTINKNFLGAIDVENSSLVTIRGWQLSANGQDGTPDWVTFNPGTAYWSVGGVRFLNVTNSVIDHNSANNDTSISYSLWNSSHNAVTWNTGDYPFTINLLLADGSQANTVDHNDLGTADFIGILVADPLPPTTYGSTANNTITNNTVHSSGPTGNEIKAGIVPDFPGGIVLLNSTSGNSVVGNQLWSNARNDLKWAQETLDPTSVIGVRTIPYVATCNVPPFGPPFNGNVWQGNIFVVQDICPNNIPLQNP